MKLRVDLLEYITDQDILEEVLANNHRYKAEPTFGKTGVGYLAPATPEEQEKEMQRSEALINRALEKLAAAQAKKAE